MLYIILSDEERGRIVGMRENEMKSSNRCICIECSMVNWFITLRNWKVRGRVNL